MFAWHEFFFRSGSSSRGPSICRTESAHPRPSPRLRHPTPEAAPPSPHDIRPPRVLAIPLQRPRSPSPHGIPRSPALRHPAPAAAPPLPARDAAAPTSSPPRSSGPSCRTPHAAALAELLLTSASSRDSSGSASSPPPLPPPSRRHGSHGGARVQQQSGAESASSSHPRTAGLRLQAPMFQLRIDEPVDIEVDVIHVVARQQPACVS
ncbi:vegetative cell wall protein gp1-like [Hordeum vulgare subsp. vulgare]|uniref:vegetative cell wall protein gp1-like n=1 Tax=Hordeum vulgare subsp. vulgare TaxID=112509 RepID=UPI001D1A32BE|nr:vegetative cell wall protein gp1-like [Hordeum vulgare subsp. vulgare]